MIAFDYVWMMFTVRNYVPQPSVSFSHSCHTGTNTSMEYLESSKHAFISLTTTDVLMKIIPFNIKKTKWGKGVKTLTWCLNCLHVSYLVSMCNDGHPVQKHCCYFSKKTHEQLGAKPFAAGSFPLGTWISRVRHCLHVWRLRRKHSYSTKFFILTTKAK